MKMSAVVLFGCLIGGALVAQAAGMPQSGHAGRGQAPSIEELKRTYLDCERGALSARLSREEIMSCSIVYEKLKRRAFGGDYTRLRAWWDTQSSALLPEQPPSAGAGKPEDVPAH